MVRKLAASEKSNAMIMMSCLFIYATTRYTIADVTYQIFGRFFAKNAMSERCH